LGTCASSDDLPKKNGDWPGGRVCGASELGGTQPAREAPSQSFERAISVVLNRSNDVELARPSGFHARLGRPGAGLDVVLR
jgi:hypothetical protein